MKDGGRQRIQEAVHFRQRLHGSVDTQDPVEADRSATAEYYGGPGEAETHPAIGRTKKKCQV